MWRKAAHLLLLLWADITLLNCFLLTASPVCVSPAREVWMYCCSAPNPAVSMVAYPWVASSSGLAVSNGVALCSLESNSKNKAGFTSGECSHVWRAGQCSRQWQISCQRADFGETWHNSSGGLHLAWAPWQPRPCVSVRCSGFLAVLTRKWVLNH